LRTEHLSRHSSERSNGGDSGKLRLRLRLRPVPLLSLMLALLSLATQSVLAANRKWMIDKRKRSPIFDIILGGTLAQRISSNG
jgi:hypothetical protein